MFNDWSFKLEAAQKSVRYLHKVTGIKFPARNSSQRLRVGNGYIFVRTDWKMSFVLSGKFVAIDEIRLYEKLSTKKKYVCLCQGLLLQYVVNGCSDNPLIFTFLKYSFSFVSRVIMLDFGVRIAFNRVWVQQTGRGQETRGWARFSFLRVDRDGARYCFAMSPWSAALRQPQRRRVNYSALNTAQINNEREKVRRKTERAADWSAP